VKRALAQADVGVELLQHSLAEKLPSIIRPQTRKLTIAITARCNLRCLGCRYERDFMLGEQLSLSTVKEVLDDAAELGIETVRLYGGEPLVHPQLPEMVAHAVKVGVRPYVTTNGMLLDRRITALFDAGLRDITIGFYGFDEALDVYTQRKGRFAQLERSLETVRARVGRQVKLQLNYLIMRPTAKIEVVRRVWELAKRFDMSVHTDLVHYSLPYFTPGVEQEIYFKPEDEDDLRSLVDELLRLKRSDPTRIPESEMGLRSIPEWLLKGPEMRIPCDVRNMAWIGANGVVQLCYVTFVLGNLREKRLKDILYTSTHREAARAAFRLDCPNCHCERDNRIRKHWASRQRFGG
jgi:cyclic pyranopterin phosphate synthase